MIVHFYSTTFERMFFEWRFPNDVIVSVEPIFLLGLNEQLEDKSDLNSVKSSLCLLIFQNDNSLFIPSTTTP